MLINHPLSKKCENLRLANKNVAITAKHVKTIVVRKPKFHTSLIMSVMHLKNFVTNYKILIT